MLKWIDDVHEVPEIHIDRTGIRHLVLLDSVGNRSLPILPGDLGRGTADAGIGSQGIDGHDMASWETFISKSHARNNNPHPCGFGGGHWAHPAAPPGELLPG